MRSLTVPFPVSEFATLAVEPRIWSNGTWADGHMGMKVTNPIAQILSVALMLRHSLDSESAATAVIGRGLRTGDIRAASDSPSATTREMGQAIIDALAG